MRGSAYSFCVLMVLREGVETVLILSAVAEFHRTDEFLGTLLGVLAAIAFGVMFVKAAWDQPAEILPGHDRYFVLVACVGGGRLHELSKVA